MPLFGFYWLMYPFIRVLNGSANVVLQWAGVELAQEGGAAHSIDEIRQILLTTRRHGGLEGQKTDLATRALDLLDLEAADLMQPISDLACLSLDLTPAEMLVRIESNRFSHYPLFERDHERLLGVVQAKDVLPSLRRDGSLDLRASAQPALVVNRDESLASLLHHFREGRSQLALLTDGPGRFVGFVTMHDLAEAVFGRAQDEYRTKDWKRLDDGSYVGSGALSVHSLERLLNVRAPVRNVDTIGWLVMWKLDRVPHPGDRVLFDGFEVRVVRMHGSRITQLHVYARPAPSPAAGTQ